MSMLNNGIAGMNAASLSLIVTSNNISNASVDGYSRQQAVFHTSPNGSVSVDRIERISDQFYTTQVQDSATSLGYATVYANQNAKLEQTLSSESMSVTPAMNDFFKGLNAAQADPMDVAYRQQVLSDADNLAARFNGLAEEMNDQLEDVQSQLDTMLGEANGLLNQVAKLNVDIAKQSAAGEASPELLDERDKAIKTLSELVGVDVIHQGDGSVDLFLANGEPLVVGSNASELVMAGSDASQIGLKNGRSVKVMREVGGGVQAQLDFRDDVLKPAQEELNQLAKVFAEEFNARLTAGFDLEGEAGVELFKFDDGNEAGSLKVIIDDPEKLAFSAAKDEPGNNENLLDLADLQDEKLADPADPSNPGLGGKTLNGFYNAMTVDIASKTAAAKADYEANSKIFQTASSNLLSVAGVNLDEEAANLVVFQQSYNANAKVISTANEMMDLLLNM